MNAFVSDIRRDASNSIRGFVYQVEQTILSWLNLTEGQYLQLEAGEDIDEVVGFLKRTTVQVKDDRQNITLRSVAPYIAQAITTQRKNPEWFISMRYLTTAQVGLEDGDPFGVGKSGIAVWNELHRSQDITSNYLPLLLSFLRILNRTNSFTEDSWTEFDDFRSQADHIGLLALVRQISWQSASTPHADMEKLLNKRLLDLEVGKAECKACLERLFYRVFQLLTSQGPRILSVQDRNEVLLSIASASDAASIHELSQRLADFDVRVGGFDERVSNVERRIEPLEALVIPAKFLGQFGPSEGSGQYTGSGVGALLELLADLGDTSPPPIDVDWIRTTNLENAKPLFQVNSWLSLVGGVLSGKSTTARQIADASEGKVVWVRLSGSDQVLKIEALRFVFAQSYRATWSEALSNLTSGSVLVLDDIKLHDSVIADKVARIVTACGPYGIKVITTSTRFVNSKVPKSCYEVFTVQPWNLDDIQRLLIKAGGPPDAMYMNPLGATVAAITKGQPALIRFMTSHLVSQQWGFNQAFFEKLFQMRPASALADETTDRLVSELKPSERELLFRLVVPTLPFSEKYVDTVSREEVPIVDSFAIRNRLLDGWISRSGNRFTASALVSGFSDKLATSTLRRCHHWAALDILELGKQNANETLALIGHLHQAGDLDLAVATTANFLIEILRVGGESLDLYGPILLTIPIPVVRHGMELILRAQRALTAKALGKNVDIELDRVCELADLLTTDDAEVALLAFATLVDKNSPLPFDVQAALLRVGLSADIEMPDGESKEKLLLALAPNIRTSRDAHRFIGILKQIHIDDLAEVFSWEGGDLARAMFDNIWLSESNKPEGEQSWSVVLEALDELLDGAKELKQSCLSAIVARMRAIVMGEYMHLTADASDFLESTLNEEWLDPADIWLLKVSRAMQLIYGGLISDGVNHLSDAMLNVPQGKHRYILFWARMDLARQIARTSTAKALDQVSLARLLAQDAIFGDHDRFRCEAENMLLAWSVTGAMSCWPYADSAGRILIAADLNDVVKSDFIQFGHALTYISVEFIDGTPPAYVEGGGEFMAPYIGMFGTSHRMRIPLYDPLKRAFITKKMVDFAGAVGDDSAERFWIARLKEQLAIPGGQKLTALVAPVLLRRALQDIDPESAVEVFASSLPIQIALGTAFRLGCYPKLDENFDVAMWLKKSNSSDFREAAFPMFRFLTLTATCLIASFGPENAETIQFIDRLHKSMMAAQLPLTLDEARSAFVRLLELTRSGSQGSDLYGFGEAQPDDSRATQACARLLASVSIDCEPERALELQTSIEQSATRIIGFLDGASLDMVLTKFLEGFWRNKFEQSPFRFQSPRFALQWLEEAATTGERSKRPGQILTSMRQALGI